MRRSSGVAKPKSQRTAYEARHVSRVLSKLGLRATGRRLWSRRKNRDSSCRASRSGSLIVVAGSVESRLFWFALCGERQRRRPSRIRTDGRRVDQLGYQ